MGLTTDARQLAEACLATDLPTRWDHVSAVAARAMRIEDCLEVDEPSLIAAAWLHDIGYAPRAQAVSSTDLHALDGARFLRSKGVLETVCSLVAYHSGAEHEAEVRGLSEQLQAEFDPPDRARLDLLWYCDFTTGPRGEPMELDVRLDEIRRRYGRGDPVTEYIDAGEAEIRAAMSRVEARLGSVASS